MTIPSHRLDALGGALIARLEGARPAWGADPSAAAAAVDIAFADVVEPVLAERRRLLGEGAAADWSRAELGRSFTPRYLALAVQQNIAEAQVQRLRGPLGRVGSVLGALIFGLVVSRMVRGPAALAVWPVLALGMFLPDLHAWWARRRYRDALQAVVDDLGRIQDALEASPAREESAP